MLPVDHVVVTEIAAGAANEAVETIGADKIGVDIGPKTIVGVLEVIAGAKTIIWNGPMGIFEKPIDTGTVALAEAVAGSGRFRWWTPRGHQGGGASPTELPTSPRVAVRRSNSWRALRCRASPR